MPVFHRFWFKTFHKCMFCKENPGGQLTIERRLGTQLRASKSLQITCCSTGSRSHWSSVLVVYQHNLGAVGKYGGPARTRKSNPKDWAYVKEFLNGLCQFKIQSCR